VSPYYAFVAIGFVAPSVDRQNRNLTFGTFIAIINLCLRLMIRVSVGHGCNGVAVCNISVVISSLECYFIKFIDTISLFIYTFLY